MVKNAPCQEAVVDHSNIDILKMLPVLTHSEVDAGRIIGSGNYLFTGDVFNGGTDILFKKDKAYGQGLVQRYGDPGKPHKDAPGEAQGQEAARHHANIGTPPAVLLVAGTGVMPTAMPYGGDEARRCGNAGQGEPVEMVKAKTVDAYSVAQSEIVLEGYITATRDVWESEEAEKMGKGRQAPFFPEWPKYLGRARKVYRFDVTAVTHRKDPIYYAPLADSSRPICTIPCSGESCLYHTLEQMAPGLVQDIFQAWPAFLTTKIQIKKRSRFDDGWERKPHREHVCCVSGNEARGGGGRRRRHPQCR